MDAISSRLWLNPTRLNGYELPACVEQVVDQQRTGRDSTRAMRASRPRNSASEV